MDPVTAIGVATAAFNTIKKEIVQTDDDRDQE